MSAFFALWTSVILLAFVWSVLLFALRIHDERKKSKASTKPRRQETGALYAVLGLILYAISYADRLPVSLTALRDPLTLLPGVTHADLAFSASWVILALISLVYVGRILVYFQLVPVTPYRGHSDVDLKQYLNDKVAPILALITLDLCITSLLGGTYRWTWIEDAACFVIFFALYHFRVFDWAYKGLSESWKEVVKAYHYVRRFFRFLPVYIVLGAVQIELMRPAAPGSSSSSLQDWINTFLKTDLPQKQRDKLQKAKDRLEQKELRQREKRQKGQKHD